MELITIYAVAGEGDGPLASDMVSSQFVGTSHEISKICYWNGWSRKVEIKNIKAHGHRDVSVFW